MDGGITLTFDSAIHEGTYSCWEKTYAVAGWRGGGAGKTMLGPSTDWFPHVRRDISTPHGRQSSQMGRHPHRLGVMEQHDIALSDPTRKAGNIRLGDPLEVI